MGEIGWVGGVECAVMGDCEKRFVYIADSWGGCIINYYGIGIACAFCRRWEGCLMVTCCVYALRCRDVWWVLEVMVVMLLGCSFYLDF